MRIVEALLQITFIFLCVYKQDIGSQVMAVEIIAFHAKEMLIK
jgi:hypothetical protein